MEGSWSNSGILSNPQGVTVPQLEPIVHDFFLQNFILSYYRQKKNLKSFLKNG